MLAMVFLGGLRADAVGFPINRTGISCAITVRYGDTVSCLVVAFVTSPDPSGAAARTNNDKSMHEAESDYAAKALTHTMSDDVLLNLECSTQSGDSKRHANSRWAVTDLRKWPEITQAGQDTWDLATRFGVTASAMAARGQMRSLPLCGSIRAFDERDDPADRLQPIELES
jgi:hypothetical protein